MQYNHYIISDVICVNLHPLTVDYRTVILALQVDRMFQPNRGRIKHCITGCKKMIKLAVTLIT